MHFWGSDRSADTHAPASLDDRAYRAKARILDLAGWSLSQYWSAGSLPPADHPPPDLFVINTAKQDDHRCQYHGRSKSNPLHPDVPDFTHLLAT